MQEWNPIFTKKPFIRPLSRKGQLQSMIRYVQMNPQRLAPKLIKTINFYEALGYLDTKNLSSTDLYDLLEEHFHLMFKVRTFQDYRSK